MARSTFAGKSTEDTIRNYAEMLIDDLNSNLPENAGKHWEKAREIDNQLAKEIFGGEYSDRIGEAYYNCLVNFKHGELGVLWNKWWDQVISPMTSGEVVLQTTSDALFGAAHSKFYEAIQVASVGLTICPQSADIHGAAALIGITHLVAGTDLRKKDADLDSKEGEFAVSARTGVDYTLKDTRLAEYKEVMPIVEKHVASALGIQPRHPRALEAKKLLEEIDKWEPGAPGCFIATAAYGTPFAEEIDVLRNWRDDFLHASYPGRLFIRTYYSLSPPVADNISESDGKRKIVRIALGPIVKVLKGRYSYEN